MYQSSTAHPFAAPSRSSSWGTSSRERRTSPLSPLAPGSRRQSEDEEDANTSRSSTESSATDEGYTSDTGDETTQEHDDDLSSPRSMINSSSSCIPSPLQASLTTNPSHPYSRSSSSPSPTPIPYRQPRSRGITPLSSLHSQPSVDSPPTSQPQSQAQAQSLSFSRTLFTRLANDVPHAGLGVTGGKKKAGGQKLIVPTRGFKTTFELDLTASELARRS